MVQLLYDHANRKVDVSTFSNMHSIWSIQPSSTTLCFIDIIKGIVPSILADKIHEITRSLEMTSLIISIFMDTIYKDVCSLIWNPRCAQQQLDEYNAGISRREKKRKNISTNKLPSRTPLVVTNDLFNEQLGLLHSTKSGGNWLDFMFKLTFDFFRRWFYLNSFSGPVCVLFVISLV